jgi:hypothetical protein
MTTSPTHMVGSLPATQALPHAAAQAASSTVHAKQLQRISCRVAYAHQRLVFASVSWRVARSEQHTPASGRHHSIRYATPVFTYPCASCMCCPLPLQYLVFAYYMYCLCCVLIMSWAACAALQSGPVLAMAPLHQHPAAAAAVEPTTTTSTLTGPTLIQAAGATPAPSVSCTCQQGAHALWVHIQLSCAPNTSIKMRKQPSMKQLNVVSQAQHAEKDLSVPLGNGIT